MGISAAKLGRVSTQKDSTAVSNTPNINLVTKNHSHVATPCKSNSNHDGLRRRRQYIRRTVRGIINSRIVGSVPVLDGVHERLGISRAVPIGPRKSFASNGSRSLPQSTISPSPPSRSAVELRTKSSFATANDDWDAEKLLQMSDVVRIALKAGALPRPDMKMLNGLLEDFLADENNTEKVVSLGVISRARLDKLLKVLTDEGFFLPAVDEAFAEVHQKAHLLQRKWQRRFLASYFELDDARVGGMRARRLHDMSLCVQDGQGQNWSIDKRNPIDGMEGSLSFELGAWWVNLCAAFRDGIVGSPIETVTKGHYGVTALPMMTGTELIGEDGIVKLIRRGELKDTYPRLLSHVGRVVRVLRGHGLRSQYAPLAGVRYDGLYKIKKYGQKLCLEKELYQLELTLERVPAQRSMEELQRIPMPSELDDWQIYMELLAKDIRERKGDVAYNEWKAREEQKEREQEEWRRWTDFRRQHSQLGGSKSKMNSTLVGEPYSCEQEKKKRL
ncbi:hypothetical protein BP6252_01516 [Coleophoma cylindrospora]|uniref:Uncharacterized protein n=1 Tax=Coleophoma cylindrospora TaxID=1849047 RepID=A0A3D8STC4_9HELO|nr:hypothetical protein BP6252_01516 [Coleophoma cylindrospora]